ncbi:hypothetical protein [Streptomyces sp. AN091965]|uniref:hypothetical protein n=1 Tax=Streptomyces sp. AN091965 TaxID=2927803 RepID=UPI001F605F3C|nr:hypothetical protein [Streptomyces sp. AN091965]MCI3928864.1 hypothetical protein [Streptomyces sp. AN091965]
MERFGVFTGTSSRLPFEVTVVGSGLADCLKAMVSRGFHFSSVAATDVQRFALQARLAQADPDEITRRCSRDGTVDGVVGVIRDTGVLPPSECERLRRVWSFWLAAEQSGRLATRPEAFYGDDSGSFELEDFASIPLRTEAGRRARDRVDSSVTLDTRTGVRRRSLVNHELSSLTELGDPDCAADARTLSRAFDRCYYRQIATVEGAMLSAEGSDRLRGIRRRAALRHAREDRTVVFPHGFKASLGAMDTRRWMSFLESVGDELDAWWYGWESDGLQAIGDRLAAETAQARSSRSGLSVTAFVTTASGAAGTLASTSLAGMSVGAGVSLATWIVNEHLGRRTDDLMRRHRVRYDVVEVGPPDATP